MKIRLIGVAALAAFAVAGLAAPVSATCYIEPHVHVDDVKDPVHFHVYCGPPPA